MTRYKIVALSEVGDRLRRFYVYTDSAERTIKSGRVPLLHMRPAPNWRWYECAIVEDVDPA